MLKSRWLYPLVILFMLTKSYAQNIDKKWAVALLGGKTEYVGDLGFAPFHFDQPFFWNLGLKGSYYLNPSFNITLQATFGNHGYWKFNNTATSFRSHMFQTYTSLEYKFANGYILAEDFILNPYLFAGLGFANHNLINGGASHFDMTIPLGLGIELRADENWSLFWQSTIGFTTGDMVDLTKSKATDAFALHQIGVKISLGKAKDTDEDGIADKDDQCPEIAGLEKHKGCPDSDGDGLTDSKDDCPEVAGRSIHGGCPDTDEDGILDKEDNCPETAGLEDFNGCPDTDSDGIQDSEDNCPEVAGLPQLNGCPDTDGDGITDKEDNCPQIAGLKDFNGCPDTDSDGVQDSEDNCPEVAGLPQLNGCPDTDGDGITDKKDDCPQTAGTIENNGCPKVEEKVKELLLGIQFNTNLANITPKAATVLDQLVNLMKEYPKATLTIEGHTDSKGSEAMNLILSKNRAEEVLKYLSSKSIADSRMSTKGYGEDKPIAPNTTAAGRAKNRRVEFRLQFN